MIMGKDYAQLFNQVWPNSSLRRCGEGGRIATGRNAEADSARASEPGHQKTVGKSTKGVTMKNRAGSNHRILTTEEVRNATANQLRWWRALGYLFPIAGGSPEGEGEDDGAGSGAGEGDNPEGAGSGGDDNDEHDDVDADSEDDPDDDDDDKDDRKGRVELKRDEYERLKRIARDHDRAEKKRQREEQRLKEKQRREQGQYEDLLKEKDDRIAEVEGERDEARYQLDSFKRRVRVTDAAKRLAFKDPDDAFRFLSDEDTEDEVTTERALKRLAKSKSYLVSERRSTGAPVGGDGVTLTVDQLKNLTPEEINARWPEVQKAMAAG